MLDLCPQVERLSTKPCRIAIKANGRILFVDPADVVTCEARGNYVSLTRMSGCVLMREAISSVADRLQPYGFVRIHRSVLINTSFIEEIRPLRSGRQVLRVKGGKEFQVSRRYRKNLHSITALWFGTEGFASD